MADNGSAASRKIGQHLARRIGDHTYDMWFGNTTRLKVEGSCVRVAAESRFVADWIDDHFRADLDRAAREALGERAQVQLRVAPGLFEDDAAAPAASRHGDPGLPEAVWRPGREARRAERAPGPELRRLDDFVVGASNRLAFTAAERIAGRVGGSSPLLIHGECGVGKTHLLQGTAHRTRNETQGRRQSGGPAATARYLSAEQFTNEYINAVRANTIGDFRKRIRKLDLLAIDDVHFLCNKTATQREFLHTIDAIDLAGGRIMLASNDHPLQLGLSQALSSRFVAGMVARIERPDRETRIRIVQRLADSRGLAVAEVAAQAIASRCVGSVRELEGAVNKLAALQLVGPKSETAEVGLVLVEQVFCNGSWRPKTPLHVNDVIEAVCDRLVVSRADLMGSGRHRRVVAARGLVAYLARALTTLSYPEIAQSLGRKHHSTVHTAVGRVTKQLGEQHRVEVGENGDSVTLCDLIDQLRHEIVKGKGRRHGGT